MSEQKYWLCCGSTNPKQHTVRCADFKYNCWGTEETHRVFLGLKPSSSAPVVSLPTDNAARKRMQMWTFLVEYFPDTFLAVLECALVGNDQHHAGERLHWAREKSTDQMNTAFRHMWDHGRGTLKDTDGVYHLAKAIWRLSAELQLTIERDNLKEI